MLKLLKYIISWSRICLLNQQIFTSILRRPRAMCFTLNVQYRTVRLRLNHIYSEPSFFDQRCNQLEKWLLDREYSDKLVRGQMLKARKFKRNELLNRERLDKKDPKLVLNITYYRHFLSSKMFSKKSIYHLLLMRNIAALFQTFLSLVLNAAEA